MQRSGNVARAIFSSAKQQELLITALVPHCQSHPQNIA